VNRGLYIYQEIAKRLSEKNWYWQALVVLSTMYIVYLAAINNPKFILNLSALWLK
jgi:hypothetical protein